MKRSLLVLVLTLGISAIAAAQVSTTAATTSPRKARTLSGQVSLDGKTLVGNDDELWSIVNPAAVAGHEGQKVTVKCQMSDDKLTVFIYVLKPSLTETRYVARPSDSAFRR